MKIRLLVVGLLALLGLIVQFSWQRDARPTTTAEVGRTTVATIQGVAPTGARSGAPAKAKLKLSPADERRVKRGIRRAARIQAKREQWLKSPEAKRAREKSRTAFVRQSPEAARATAHKFQPAVAKVPVWSPPHLRKRERVTGFISQTQAVIEDAATGKRSLIDSVGGAPIALAKPGVKGLTALDLTLARSVDGFRPKTSRVPVTLPIDTAKPIAIGDKVRLSLGGAAQGTLSAGGKKVFYANQGLDTDAIIEATPQGISASWILRSPQSPAQLAFKIDGVKDTDVSINRGGSLDIGGADGQVGTVTAPVAVDAQGVAVAARFAKTKQGIEVVVDHQAQDVAYPIAVDPIFNLGGAYAVVERIDDGSAKGQPIQEIWGSSIAPNSRSFFFGRSYPTFYISVGSEGGGGSAWWAFDPIRDSSAYRAEFQGAEHTNANYTCLLMGLYSRSVGWPETGYAEYAQGGVYQGAAGGVFQNCSGMPRTYVTACVTGGCGLGGSSNNIVAFQQNVGNRPGGLATTAATFEGAYIFHRESIPPTASVSGMPSESSWTNAAQLSATISAHDDGVGLCSDGNQGLAPSLEVRTVDTNALLGVAANGGCTGMTYYQPAPADYTYSWAEAAGSIPSGSRTLRFMVRDAVDNRAYVDRGVKIDREAPAIQIGGRMADYGVEAASGIPVDVRSFIGKTNLTVMASDGGSNASESQKRAGVQQVNASLWSLNDSGDRIAGTNRLLAADSCAVDNCSIPLTVTAGQFPVLNSGLYELAVAASDRAGNATTKRYVFAIGGGEISTVVEGQATSRWIPLQLDRTKDATGADIPVAQRANTTAKIEWFRDVAPKGWVSLPSDALKREDTEQSVSSDSVPMTQGLTARYVVDLSLLPAAELVKERVRLRATFADGVGYAFRSEDVMLRRDAGGRDASNASLSSGPGRVDLMTGNLSVSSTDAEVGSFKGGLSLTRTYASRYSEETGVMGRGWKLGTPAEDLSTFKQLLDLQDTGLPEQDRYPAVLVEFADGGQGVFERSETTGGYIPELAMEDFELTRVAASDPTKASHFVIRDRTDGTLTRFAENPPATADTGTGAVKPGTWMVSESIPATSSRAATYTYGNVAGAGRQLTRIIGASDGIDCNVTPFPRGCQRLDLVYGPADGSIACNDQAAAVAGGAAPVRLRKVLVTQYDPATAAMATVPVTCYGYGANQLLASATDARSGLGTTFEYQGATALLSQIKSSGLTATQLTYASIGSDPAGTTGRLQAITKNGLASTFQYEVPRTGSDAPYQLGWDNVDDWGQKVAPFRATAVYPTGVASGTTATARAKAAITYMDALGRRVNLANQGGRISSFDFNKYGNLTRALEPANRERALAGPNPLALADRLSTQTVYSSDKWQRIEQILSPERPIRATPGSAPVSARARTRFGGWDAGVPAPPAATGDPQVDANNRLGTTADPSYPFNLATLEMTGAVVTSTGAVIDEKTQKTEYDWRSGNETKVISDVGGINDTRTFTFDADGNEIERRQPSGTATTATKTVPYGRNAPAPCNANPEWAGLQCTTGPVTQPSGNPLPVKRMFYDYWRRPLRVEETVGAEVRVTTVQNDAIGRAVFESVGPKDGSTPLSGTAVAGVQRVFSPTTGLETETRMVSGGLNSSVISRVKRGYDAEGRLTSYETTKGPDGSEVSVSKSTTSWDELSRPVQETQYSAGAVIGTRNFGYDAVTGDLTTVADVGPSTGQSVGTITASYDANGRPITIGFPFDGNGAPQVYKGIAYDATGAVSSTSYVKTANCGSSCVWYSTNVVRSATGRIVEENTTLGDSKYEYDGIGRLVSSQQTRPGDSCATRSYTYDANSNRQTRRVHGGTPTTCAAPSSTGGTLYESTYADDRQTTASSYGQTPVALEYDAWGRVKFLPRQATIGAQDVESTYYVNDLARTVKQGTTTVTNDLDALMRAATRTTQVQGEPNAQIETFGFGDDSDSPMYVRRDVGSSTSWTRYVQDPTGGLSVQISSTGLRALQVTNVRGDVVAEVTSPSGLGATFVTDEFGIPKQSTMNGRTYGFKGGAQRASIHGGNVVLMGARSYNPTSGRFLQPDPIVGGSANAYDYAYQDPVNNQDLEGKKGLGKTWWGCLIDSAATGDSLCGLEVLFADRKKHPPQRKKSNKDNNYKGGRAEETVSRQRGIPRNTTQTFGSYHYPNKTRRPDFLTTKQLIEVKNVNRQGFTKQIEDYLLYAYAQRPKRTVTIVIAARTVLTKQFRKMLQHGFLGIYFDVERSNSF